MEPLLLLHGAIGASGQFAALKERLSSGFRVFTPDFSGHGGRPFADQHFSMELFANDVLQYMERERLDKVSIFGYSMGGYVGMYLAKHHPGKIDKIITLATKYHWDEAIASREVQMLIPEKIEQKIPAFAAALKERHTPNDWRDVLKKTSAMMMAMGRNNTLKLADYTTITTPALILLGDLDKMVSLDETVAVYKSLPKAQMGMLPDTPHPIEQVDVELLGFLIERFLK